MKNANGITTNVSQATEFRWRASIAKFRPASLNIPAFQVTYTSPGGSFSSVKIQDHSPIMSGTFTASIGGLPIQILNSTSGLYTISNIPFNVEASVLEQALRRIIGFENV